MAAIFERADDEDSKIQYDTFASYDIRVQIRNRKDDRRKSLMALAGNAVEFEKLKGLSVGEYLDYLQLKVDKSKKKTTDG